MSPTQHTTVQATVASLVALWVGIGLGARAWDPREAVAAGGGGTLLLLVGAGALFRRQERDVIVAVAEHGPTYCPHCGRHDPDPTSPTDFDETDQDPEAWRG